MKQYTIPIFVTNYGCQFKCIYCNQEIITNHDEGILKSEVEDTINEYLSYFDQKAYIEVGFFGGSFTGIDKSIQKEFLSVAKNYKDNGEIDGIRLSTRPDLIDDERLKLLKDYSVDTIELGVQSLNDEVLKLSNRGHNSDIVYKSAELIKKWGFNLGLQMMIGLPSDTYERSLYTAKEFIRLSPDCVRIYPTVVIEDTPLEIQYNNGLYKPLSLEDSINITKEIMMLFDHHNINMIRVGLQSTEDITIGKSIIKGPYHPAYREIVESRIYRDIIDYKLDKSTKKLEIEANPRYISKIIGNKKSNKEYFTEKYNLESFKLTPNKNIKNGDMVLITDKHIVEANYLDSIRDLLEVKNESEGD